jgi:isopentenyl diphosphate isomerase/L-lactate dehydrogenase-like FMN-dependent dehydrogenase
MRVKLRSRIEYWIAEMPTICLMGYYGCPRGADKTLRWLPRSSDGHLSDAGIENEKVRDAVRTDWRRCLWLQP